MLSQHSGEIWRDFPKLNPRLLFAKSITPDVSVSAPVVRFTADARSRLAQGPEGELAEVQAWRRAFARMGLKPTQYSLRRGVAAAPPLHPRGACRGFICSSTCATPSRLPPPSRSPFRRLRNRR